MLGSRQVREARSARRRTADVQLPLALELGHDRPLLALLVDQQPLDILLGRKAQPRVETCALGDELGLAAHLLLVVEHPERQVLVEAAGLQHVAHLRPRRIPLPLIRHVVLGAAHVDQPLGGGVDRVV